MKSIPVMMMMIVLLDICASEVIDLPLGTLSTLRTAITYAPDGSTIMMASGTWTGCDDDGSVNVPDKNITIRGAVDVQGQGVTIDCVSGLASVFNISFVTQSTVRIERMTIMRSNTAVKVSII